MEFFKFKIRHLPLGCLLLTLLSACALEDPPRPNTLTFGVSTTPGSLDPRFLSDALAEKIAGLTSRGLLKHDPNGQLVNDLAQTFELLSPTRYRITLPAGLLFAHGAPLTAHDVAYTFRSVLDPASHSVKRISLEYLQNIEVLDPLTLLLTLSRPFAPFAESLTLGIVPRDWPTGTNQAALPPPASGPYRLVQLRHAQDLRLEANPLYAGPPPRVPNLRFKIIPDANARALELIHGSVDLVQNDLPAYLVKALRQRAGLKHLERESTLVKYLAFNLRDPLLARLPVRQAIAHALNPAPIIAHRLQNLARAAHTLLPTSSFAFSKQVTRYPYDPARATALLEAAGLPDPDGAGPLPRFSLVYRTSLDQVGIGVARVFQAQLRPLGIALEIQPSEWGVFFRDIKQGAFQLYSLTAVGINDPDYLTFLCHSASAPPNGANRGGYASLEVDRLLELGRASLDIPLRADFYAQAQARLSQDLPYLPLWYEKSVALMQARVEGYFLTPTADFQALPFTRLREVP